MVEEFPKIEDIDSRHLNAQNVKSKWPHFYEYLMRLDYPDSLKISERLYWYFHNLTKHPVCPICGKETSYINFKKGYNRYCSVSCSRKDPESEEKRKQTNIKKYGTEYPNQSKIVQDKIEKTMMERYGVKHALQNKDFLQKSQETCEKHHGVKYPAQNKEILNKQLASQIRKYGGIGVGSDKIKEKIKQTNLERYGAEFGWGAEEIREKSLKKWKEKYGVENPFAADEIKEKIKQTNLERYGVENPGWTEESQLKIKQTNLERYGIENPNSLNEIKEKIKQTNLERYGVEHYTQTEEFRSRIPEIKEKEYYTKKKNNSFNSSKIEQDFKQWLIDNNIEFDYQHHDDIYPFDCDFYFPKTNSYLEIQGSWTHGGHPYDSNNEADLKKKEFWTNKNTDFYKTAIETWTERDVKKRQWAKEHNLNWHESFTIDIDVLINECMKFNIF